MQAPLQNASPVGQQWPEVQVWLARQAVPPAPQFASSVCRSAHAVAHAVVPCGHSHTPAAHASFASGQACSHVPQFCGSVWRFLQPALHFVSGAVHAHAPVAQISFVPQAFPHAPQLSRSVSRFVQRGFDAGQEVSAPHWQAPAEHVPPPHEMPQAPQLYASVWYDAGSTQNPWHFSCPEGHSSLVELHPEHRERKAAAATRRTSRAGRVMATMIRPPSAGA